MSYAPISGRVWDMSPPGSRRDAAEIATDIDAQREPSAFSGGRDSSKGRLPGASADRRLLGQKFRPGSKWIRRHDSAHLGNRIDNCGSGPHVRRRPAVGGRVPASDACGLRQSLHSHGNVHEVPRRFKNRVAAFRVQPWARCIRWEARRCGCPW